MLWMTSYGYCPICLMLSLSYVWLWGLTIFVKILCPTPLSLLHLLYPYLAYIHSLHMLFGFANVRGRTQEGVCVAFQRQIHKSCTLSGGASLMFANSCWVVIKHQKGGD